MEQLPRLLFVHRVHDGPLESQRINAALLAVDHSALAYKRSLWWFFGCLFLPPVSIVFLLLNLKTTFKPFVISFAGLVLACFGGWLADIQWFVV